MFVCESVRNIKAVLNPENSVFTKHTLVVCSNKQGGRNGTKCSDWSYMRY